MVLHPVFSFRELGTRVSDVLLRRNDAALRELIGKAGDEELGQLIDTMAVKEKVSTFRALSADRRARVIDKLSEYSQETVLRSLAKEELEAMIGAAESDDAVGVIQMLDGAARARVVADLRRSDPNGLLPLLSYGEETAGGLMKSEFARFRAGATVGGPPPACGGSGEAGVAADLRRRRERRPRRDHRAAEAAAGRRLGDPVRGHARCAAIRARVHGPGGGRAAVR